VHPIVEAAVIAALVELELHLPAPQSLKAKRGVVKPLVAALRRDLSVSVAEIDHQDRWQRATLGVAIAASSEIGARKVAQSVEKIVVRDPRIELIRIDVDVVESEF
jgi:uncharacterized protein YlxP (DUF503 family)